VGRKQRGRKPQALRSERRGKITAETNSVVANPRKTIFKSKSEQRRKAIQTDGGKDENRNKGMQ